MNKNKIRKIIEHYEQYLAGVRRLDVRDPIIKDMVVEDMGGYIGVSASVINCTIPTTYIDSYYCLDRDDYHLLSKEEMIV